MISVIVPAYNLEKYINYCINSVLQQTYTEFELILVDDGSTDNTYAVCMAACVKDARVKVIKQENQGVSAARNTGIRRAQGDYIMFMDGDDIIAPGSLEHMLEYFDENISTVIGEIIRIRTYEYSFRSQNHTERIFSGSESLKLLLEGRFPISSCAALFRRECVGKIRFPEKIKHNEDKYFMFRFLFENENMNVIRISEQVYGYYVRESSATKAKWNGSTDVVKVADKILSVMEETKPELIEKAKLASLSARLQVLKDIVLSEDSIKFNVLYKKYRNEVLRAGFPKTAGKRTKVMYAALLMGRWAFTFLAKLYYKVYSEERRFKVNEAQTSV